MMETIWVRHKPKYKVFKKMIHQLKFLYLLHSLYLEQIYCTIRQTSIFTPRNTEITLVCSIVLPRYRKTTKNVGLMPQCQTIYQNNTFQPFSHRSIYKLLPENTKLMTYKRQDQGIKEVFIT